MCSSAGGRFHVEETISAITPAESECSSWDRLPGESSKAFHAFTIYRDLGLDRSVKGVVTKWNKSQSLIYRWSVKYNWKLRVQEWDTYQDQLGQAHAIRTRLAMNKRALEIAQDMQLKALKGFAALEIVRKVKVSRKVKDEAGVERTVEEEIDKLVISPKDLVRLMESAHRLQKDLLGKADEDQVAKIEVIFGATEDEEDDPEGGGPRS
jgi:hypothetical protein